MNEKLKQLEEIEIDELITIILDKTFLFFFNKLDFYHSELANFLNLKQQNHYEFYKGFQYILNFIYYFNAVLYIFWNIGFVLFINIGIMIIDGLIERRLNKIFNYSRTRYMVAKRLLSNQFNQLKLLLNNNFFRIYYPENTFAKYRQQFEDIERSVKDFISIYKPLTIKLKEIGLISIFTGVIVRLFYDIFIKTEIDYVTLISNINFIMGIIYLVIILIRLIDFISEILYFLPKILEVKYKNISLNDCLGDLRQALILGSFSLDVPADPVMLLFCKSVSQKSDYYKFLQKDPDSKREILIDKFVDEHNKLTKKYIDKLSSDQ